MTQVNYIDVPTGLTNWETVCARIEGVTPLLMHNPEKMRRAASVGRKEIPTPEIEAETALYRNPDGTLYIKADHVREAIKAAAVGVRIGKRAARSVLASALMEHPDYPFFTLFRGAEPITTWEIDTRRTVIQKQGILRSRALIPTPWEAEVVFQYDSAVIPDPSHIITFLGQAGQISGLLDYRPNRGGSFGRFEVTKAYTQ